MEFDIFPYKEDISASLRLIVAHRLFLAQPRQKNSSGSVRALFPSTVFALVLNI